MRWWMLAGLQYSLSRVPGGVADYGRLQRRAGGLWDVTASGRFDKVEYFLSRAREACETLEGRTVVELGTGWIPVLPLAFAAAGCRVFSYDVEPLVEDGVFRDTKDALLRSLPRYAEAAGQPERRMRRRLKYLRRATTFSQACVAARVHYDGTADTTNLPHEDESVDLLVTSLVLQCMPIEAVEAVLAESFRLLKPGGYAIHRIRMTDENAAHDPEKNHFDYLRHSREHYDRWFNTKLKHLNRLRAGQFLARMRAAGFNVYKAERKIDKASLDHVAALDVDAMFAECTSEDLATTNLDVVLEKPVPWAGGTIAGRPDLSGDASDTRDTARGPVFEEVGKPADRPPVPDADDEPIPARR